MKYDSMKYDEGRNLLCYLYLENRTFVNAHLIRSGLVEIDSSYEYQYRDKFLTLSEKTDG
jgi:site-specific DNA-methyltransferase (adenine-specific)